MIPSPGRRRRARRTPIASVRAACSSSLPVPGDATVFTYTVVHHPFAPEWRDRVPYAIVLVEPDGAPGVRLVAHVVDVDPAEIRVGQRLTCVAPEGETQRPPVRFRPAGGG